MEPGAIPAQDAMASAVASLSPPLAMGVKWSNGVCGGGGGGEVCVISYMTGHLPHLMSIFRHRTPSNGKEGPGCAIAVCITCTGSAHWS